MKFRDLTDMSGSDLFHWTMRRYPTVYRDTAKITIKKTSTLRFRERIGSTSNAVLWI